MNMTKARSRFSTSKEQLSVDYSVISKASLVLRALNHKLRQQIMNLIDKKKEITVTEIYSKLKLEQSATSAHLAVLRRANLVLTRREGQSIIYRLNYVRIREI